jgi:hypothetical protein
MRVEYRVQELERQLEQMLKGSGNNTMEAEFKMKVHENEYYSVFVTRMPDMSFDTYGIVNRETGVIEQLQPNLYNARYIANQFNKWLTVGPSDEDEVSDVLAQFQSGGKVN